MNDGYSNANKKSIVNLAEPILQGSSQSRLKIEDEYPKLLSELNDASSKIPAYKRFEENDTCLLRDDLKKLKEEHFRKNYERQLKNPLETFDRVTAQKN